MAPALVIRMGVTRSKPVNFKSGSGVERNGKEVICKRAPVAVMDVPDGKE